MARHGLSYGGPLARQKKKGLQGDVVNQIGTRREHEVSSVQSIMRCGTWERADVARSR